MPSSLAIVLAEARTTARSSGLKINWLQVDLKDEQQVESAVDSQQHLQPFAAAERTRLLSDLPADTAPTAVAADKALNGSDFAVRLQGIDA